MRQIKPHQIWIGSDKDGRDFRELFDKGIRAIVQLAVEEPPIQPPHELIFYRFPLVDGIGNDSKLLFLAVNAVSALIRRGIPTLVCCAGGMSRSPGIVAAALSSVTQTGLDDCLKSVAEFHPADVLPGFWEEVCRTMEEEGSR